MTKELDKIKLGAMEETNTLFEWIFVFKEYVKQQEHETLVSVIAANKEEAVGKVMKLAIPQIEGMDEDEIYTHCDEIIEFGEDGFRMDD